MRVSSDILKQATELYLRYAYPGARPPNVAVLAQAVGELSGEITLNGSNEGTTILQRDPDAATRGYALRLGQPKYPYMKLVVEPVPEEQGILPGAGEPDFVLRVDVHDRHLHAPAGSPDAAWLAEIRQSNKELAEKIEAAWAAAGLPTFKVFLRHLLEKRKARGGGVGGGVTSH